MFVVLSCVSFSEIGGFRKGGFGRLGWPVYLNDRQGSSHFCAGVIVVVDDKTNELIKIQ